MHKRISEDFYIHRIAIKVVAFLLLLLSSTWALAQENGGYVASRDAASQYNYLLATVHDAGKIRVIVGLKTPFIPEGLHASTETITQQRSRISRMQESLRGSIRVADENSIKRFRHIPFIAMEVDEASLRTLINNPLVGSIEEDKFNGPIFVQYTIPLIGADSGEANQFSGVGQTIAILDSGVDKTHPFLSGKVVEEACFSTSDPNNGVTSLCPNGQISQTGSGAGVNCPLSFSACYHGTHVAGIAAGRQVLLPDLSSIRGVAPDANIIAIQIYSAIADAALCTQFGTTSPCVLTRNSDVIGALDYLTLLRGTYKIAAANISAGGGKNVTNCDSSSPSLKAAIDQLRSYGTATVVASGNDGYPDAISAPACISSAVSVGATEYFGGSGLPEQVAPYSNSASFLSLLAPGGCVDNVATCGILSSVPLAAGFEWAFGAGTSSAAPHVAGAWAVLRQKSPLATVEEILSAFQVTGVSLNDPKNGITKSRIQVDAALDSLAIPLPIGPTIFPQYTPVASPVISADPSAAEPMAVGSFALGGTAISIQIGTARFAGPVDIYFAYYAPSMDPDNIQILTSNYTFRPLSVVDPLHEGGTPWKGNTSAGISESLASVLGDIPISSLPPGTYTGYLLVAPAGRLDSYYLWSTSFTL